MKSREKLEVFVKIISLNQFRQNTVGNQKALWGKAGALPVKLHKAESGKLLYFLRRVCGKGFAESSCIIRKIQSFLQPQREHDNEAQVPLVYNSVHAPHPR